MQNYLFEQDLHQFFIDGGDARTMKFSYGWIVILGLVFWGSYHYLHFENWMPPIAWLAAYVVVVFCVLFYLSKGKQARYLVQISLEEQTIKAIDQKHHQDLWIDDFDSTKLYISEIQVFVGAQTYRYPALVYGDQQQELIEDSVPYSSKTVLGFGELSALESMRSVLSG